MPGLRSHAKVLIRVNIWNFKSYDCVYKGVLNQHRQGNFDLKLFLNALVKRFQMAGSSEKTLEVSGESNPGPLIRKPTLSTSAPSEYEMKFEDVSMKLALFLSHKITKFKETFLPQRCRVLENQELDEILAPMPTTTTTTRTSTTKTSTTPTPTPKNQVRADLVMTKLIFSFITSCSSVKQE